jgi:hypothetical protein
LKKELGVITAQLQSKLSRDVLLVVDSKIAKRVGQREYYLMEQLTGKGIKKELGMESDGLGKDKLIENLKFKERAASASVARARSFKLKMPEGVWKVSEEELAKLQGLKSRTVKLTHQANILPCYFPRPSSDMFSSQSTSIWAEHQLLTSECNNLIQLNSIPLSIEELPIIDNVVPFYSTYPISDMFSSYATSIWIKHQQLNPEYNNLRWLYCIPISTKEFLL